jgi:CHAT domain-containing protein
MLTLVDLGSIETIRAVFESWRQAVGIDMERGVGVEVPGADIVRERGDALRHLILDPVLAHAGDARRIVIVPDDVLHLVPFDALPAPREEGAAQASTNGDKRTPDPADVTAPSRTKASPRIELLGERLRVEMRLTAMELLEPAPAHSTANSLLAVGGASFNSEPLELEAEEVAPIEGAMVPRERSSTLLRGTRWERGFEPLPFTARESHSLAALHAEVFGPAGLARVLEARKASAAALKELAPRARWLHIATHGWFGPESIRSWEDTDPIDSKSGCVLRETGLEQVKGMCPMLLCGLALAGANLPENAVGRVPGLMTAEEVASLDLSNCELAVLSACDTARGELRRASQGVASLQKALQIAGARSVVTSLWKVPDEATKDLMLDFYRRVWVEKVPKWKALWEAKRKLRDAKDDAGRVKYTLRDWGAWVLTGRPE